MAVYINRLSKRISGLLISRDKSTSKSKKLTNSKKNVAKYIILYKKSVNRVGIIVYSGSGIRKMEEKVFHTPEGSLKPIPTAIERF